MSKLERQAFKWGQQAGDALNNRGDEAAGLVRAGYVAWLRTLKGQRVRSSALERAYAAGMRQEVLGPDKYAMA
ncbi:MAG: hypothetical protein V3S01_05585 [Dehalococcoidia bacterium]